MRGLARGGGKITRCLPVAAPAPASACPLASDLDGLAVEWHPMPDKRRPGRPRWLGRARACPRVGAAVAAHTIPLIRRRRRLGGALRARASGGAPFFTILKLIYRGRFYNLLYPTALEINHYVRVYASAPTYHGLYTKTHCDWHPMPN